MKFFILMPLIPGLNLWLVVTLMKMAVRKGDQIRAKKAQLTIEAKRIEARRNAAFDHHVEPITIREG
jgi:hypothetical protein